MTEKQSIEKIVEGRKFPVEKGPLPVGKPEWFDSEKFEDGKMFVQKHLFCIAFAQFLSLFVGLTFSRLLRPLIFSQNSETAKKALKRYALTSIHVNSWSIGDIFEAKDPARKSIESVRCMHTNYSAVFNRSVSTIDNVTVESVTGMKVSSNYLEYIQEDMKDESSGTRSPMYCPLCQKMCRSGIPVEYKDEETLYLSQLDMSFTQLGFMGLLVMYPEKFGIHSASVKELEGFIHMWRVFGYMLGIKDEFNFCNSDNYLEVRQLCFEAFHHSSKQMIFNADADYEHMATALTDGIGRARKGVSFETCFLYVFDMVGWDMPRFSSRVDASQIKSFRRMKFVFQVLLQYRVCRFVLQGFHKVYVWWFKRFLKRSGGDFKKAIKGFKDD